VTGLCKVVALDEILNSDYSLNPGRYVGANGKTNEDFDFEVTLKKLHSDFETLTTEAHKIEKQITNNLKNIKHD
jgi:type I restriction enzyme M protein